MAGPNALDTPVTLQPRRVTLVEQDQHFTTTRVTPSCPVNEPWLL